MPKRMCGYSSRGGHEEGGGFGGNGPYATANVHRVSEDGLLAILVLPTQVFRIM